MSAPTSPSLRSVDKNDNEVTFCNISSSSSELCIEKKTS